MMDPAAAEDLLPLYLRPHDVACAPTLSFPAQTSNVVLKVTVPKRTGRKRKRGSNGPFVEAATSKTPTKVGAKAVFQSLSDNPDKYQIEPIKHRTAYEKNGNNLTNKQPTLETQNA